MKLTKEQLELIRSSDKELDIDVKNGELKITEIVRRWKPKEEMFYFYATKEKESDRTFWADNYADNFLHDMGNCFKTEQEAIEYGIWYEIRKRLIELVERLGKPTKEDWENTKILKHCIKYDFDTDKVYCCSTNGIYDNNIYCLSKDFYKTAIQKLGEENIKHYYKNGWKYNQ